MITTWDNNFFQIISNLMIFKNKPTYVGQGIFELTEDV